MEERFEQIKDSGKELKSLTKELGDLKDKVKVFINQRKMFEKNIEMLESNQNGLAKRQEDIRRVLSKKEEADAKLERIKEYGQKLAQLSAEREINVIVLAVSCREDRAGLSGRPRPREGTCRSACRARPTS